ncbi:MAG: efflux RND transporter periplasmic adaptor subunit [Candidatus Melainabacteria bacterium]
MKKQILLLVMMATVVGMSGCASEKKEEAEGHLSDVIEISADAVKNASIQTLMVKEKEASGQLESVAEIRANENRVFHINPPIPGRVVEDRVLLGDVVKQGQVVAVLQNVEVAKVNAEFIHQLHQNEVDARQAKTRLALAKKNLDREKKLLEEGISPRKDYLQAETDYQLAQSELEGLQEHAVHIKSEAKALLGAYGTRLGSTHSERINTSSSLISPRSGIVTKKNVVAGDMVNPEETLYEVADLNQVWLDITLYPKDIERVKLGQKVTFTSDAIPGKAFSGAINYLQPAASETSQTFVARVFLDNPGLILKPGLFGQAVIQTEAHEPQAFIPEAAVQTYGKETFVFLVKGEGKFQKRTVELGDKVAGGYLVKSGLAAGDKVVGKGSFTLKAEMLKSQFAEEE